MALAAYGCAREAGLEPNENEKLYFDAWMQVHYPQAEKSGLGIYVIPEFEKENGGELCEPVADSQYVYVNYTARTLDGKITETTAADTAKMLGTYDPYGTYYGPVVLTRSAGYLYAGVNEIFSGMSSGSSRRAVIPGWLMTYRWYGSEQEFIDNESGTNTIYDLSVVDPIDDIEKWQIDSIGRFLSGGYASHDFGYMSSEKIKEYLSINNISSAQDSSDLYGFYFIEIEHGEELEPAEDDDDDSKDTEEDGYDWTKSHFYTTGGSNDTTIYINYVGRLLNGKVFDTNIQRVAQDNGLSGGTYEPVAIQWGDSYTELKMGSDDSSSSMITGFSLTLWRMHPFGKALGIFYSNFGYGYSGSGTAIPAYSPLMFEIEIVEKPE